jgi:hypothetical protein
MGRRGSPCAPGHGSKAAVQKVRRRCVHRAEDAGVRLGAGARHCEEEAGAASSLVGLVRVFIVNSSSGSFAVHAQHPPPQAASPPSQMATWWSSSMAASASSTGGLRFSSPPASPSPPLLLSSCSGQGESPRAAADQGETGWELL